ncbi:hypothetical protein D6783_00920 [Candidatus Woesearchaeota archaeon]|nr:MAG: hypothetical protein D6783_00920 [Candidatus Woesearchaeota archaeon]
MIASKRVRREATRNPNLFISLSDETAMQYRQAKHSTRPSCSTRLRVLSQDRNRNNKKNEKPPLPCQFFNFSNHCKKNTENCTHNTLS